MRSEVRERSVCVCVVNKYDRVGGHNNCHVVVVVVVVDGMMVVELDVVVQLDVVGQPQHVLMVVVVPQSAMMVVVVAQPHDFDNARRGVVDWMLVVVDNMDQRQVQVRWMGNG